MHQVKLFKGIETELGQLEREVNDWLKSSEAKVVNVFGNIAPQTAGTVAGASASQSSGRMFAASDILVAIVYQPA